MNWASSGTEHKTVPVNEEKNCPACEGNGKVRTGDQKFNPDLKRNVPIEKNCDPCSGTGKLKCT